MKITLSAWTSLGAKAARIRYILALTLIVICTAVGSPAPAGAEQATPQAALALARRDINRFWSGVLKSWGVPYWAPAVQWYNTSQRPGSIATPCGRIRVGNAGYCGRNGTIYLDARFAQRSFQRVGDYAIFTIVAHEWAHHIQNITGVTRDYQRGNLTTRQLELQADCWGGVYTRSTERRGILEEGDLEEALTLTLAAGDIPGTDPDDPRAHGTPEERYDAFLSGYQNGDPNRCEFA